MEIKQNIIRLLRGKIRIAFDACVYIYLFEDTPKYASLVEEIIEMIDSLKIQKMVSAMLFTELFVYPYRIRRPDIVRKWYDYFQSSGTEIAPVSSTIAIHAASLRAQYDIASPDSIHIATALQEKADLFIGNDKKLKKITDLPVVCLDDIH